jgi:hypothetical protein
MVAPNSPEAKAAMEAAIRSRAKKPTGELTKADLKKVTELKLRGKNLTDVSTLARLEQLKWLDLKYNQLADVSGLAGLKQLKTLDLRNNRLTKVSALAGLEELKWLGLSNNHITDVSALAGLTQLETLFLDRNPNLTHLEIAKLQKALPNCRIGHNAKSEAKKPETSKIKVAPNSPEPETAIEATPVRGKLSSNNVLVIESRPRWEYRYLRNALTRDPNVDVRVLLLHPGMAPGGGANYLRAFPAEARPKELRGYPGPVALADFDVIILGDVGIGHGSLTVQQARQIRKLVEHQSTGLIFMPGALGRQVSFYRWKNHQVKNAESETRESIAKQYGVATRTLEYANPGVTWDKLKIGRKLFVPHPLADLLPVVYDATKPLGNGTHTESRFKLSPEGRVSPLLLLAADESNNGQLWQKFLPGFFWHASILRASSMANTQILATHSTLRNKHGYLPLLVFARAGKGCVLFMGTDSTWRWRRGVEDRYHYAFWGQVVRRMAHRRHSSSGPKPTAPR